MAATLKGSSLAMEAQLRQRATLLQQTDEAMEHSLAQSKAAKAKAVDIHSR